MPTPAGEPASVTCRHPRSWRAGLVVAAGSVLPLLGLSAGPAGASSRAAGTPGPASVTLLVHGYGHGRGMGQYGALGYALDSGWTYQQILTHYYGTLAAGGTTTLGTLADAVTGSTGLTSDSAMVSVQLTANQGNDVTVTAAVPFVVTGSGLPAPVTVPAGGGARFALVAGTTGAPTWTVSVDTGAGTGTGAGPGACAGGADAWGTPVATGVTAPTATPATPAAFPASGTLSAQTLELCQTGAHYRGSIAGAISPSDPTVAQTVNRLPFGQYVADSAAAESPGDWGSDGGQGPQGQPAGFQQTEAQVVATRSYAVAEAVGGGVGGGVADVCDSTACQSYPGIAYENVYDDVAVQDTAGQVVLAPGGTVALTEYSASTGGYTAAGSGPGGFAAVVDAGDSVCTAQACNPYHSYTATISASAIEASFPQIGTYQALLVQQRTGLGPQGGRVLAVTVTGTTGSVTVTGSALASALAGAAQDQLDAVGGTFAASGVLSDWFAVEGQPSGGTSGYWLLGSDGGIFAFGTAAYDGSMGGKPLNEPVVGMAAVPGGCGYWEVASDGGIFSFGSATFDGSMGGKPLNEPVVGMAAVPGGGGYWEVASDGGIFSFGSAPFYGSTGAIHLNQPIVAMAVTPDGHGYWLLAADGGVFAFGDAAYFGSLPGAGVSARAVALLPTGDGNGYLIVTSAGRAIPFGDAPQLGDATTAVPGYSGTLIGGATP